MADDLARLGIQVDSSQAAQASGDLDKLSASAAGAQKATDSLSASNNSATSATAALSAATQSANTGTAKLRDAYIAAGASVAEADKVFGKMATTATATAATAIAASEATATASAESAAVQIAANDSVALSSIAVREVIVSLRDVMRGQTSRLGSSLSILVQQFVPLTAATLAFSAGILVTVGGLAALAIAAAESTEANRLLEAEISGVGRMSGVTADQITAAATATASSQNKSIGTTQAWAQSYAATGKIAGGVLTGLTEITTAYAEATGETTANALKELAADFTDPTKGANTLNNQLGILNATQLTHIQQLAAEGDRLGAQKALYAALDTALDNTAQQHVTGLIAAWQDVATWAGNAYHAMIVAAGGGTLAEQLALAQSRLSAIQEIANRPGNQGGVIQAQYQAAKKAVDDLTSAIAKNQAQQGKNFATASLNQASTAGIAVANSVLPDSNTLSDLTDKLDILQKAKDAAAHAGDSASTIQKINDAYQAVADTIGRVTTATGQYIPLATRQHEIAVLQAQEDATTNSATKVKLATQIALLKTGSDIITNQEAFTKAQDAGNIVAEKASKIRDSAVTSAQNYLTGLQSQTKNQSTLNLAIENGTTTIQQAIDQAKVESALKTRIAALDNDKKLTDQQRKTLIQGLTDAQIANNAALKDFQVLQENNAEQNSIAVYKEQIALAGQDNATRAVAIAQLQEMQKLGLKPGESQTPAQAMAINSAGQNATAQLNAGRANLLNANTDTGTALGKSTASGIFANPASSLPGQDPLVIQQKAALDEITKMQQQNVLSFQQGELAKAQIVDDMNQRRLQSTSDMFGALAGLSNSSNKTLAAIGKDAAIVQATISAYSAINKAWDSAPFPANLPAVAVVTAQTFANIAAIEGFATGVVGLSGPGSGTSDSIPAWLSAGESVITAQATRNNRSTLAAMNAGANFDARRGGGDVITVSPVFQVDARGAQQGVADQIKRQLAEVAPAIVSAAVASAKKQSPNWVAAANKTPRQRT